MRPGVGQTYGEVATAVPNGKSIRVAVLETSGTPGAWRVWVDGRAVTPAFMLTGSHGMLAPMAMAESWDGGRPACNRFSYRFDKVSVAAAPGGSWLPARDAAVLQDPGFKVVKRAAASFDAGAASTLAAPVPDPTPVAPASGPAKSQSVTVSAPAAPAVSAAPADQPVRVLAAVQAISADAPLRKGFLPSPTEDAIYGLTPVDPAQPAVAVTPVPAPVPVTQTETTDLGLGGSVTFTEALPA